MVNDGRATSNQGPGPAPPEVRWVATQTGVLSAHVIVVVAPTELAPFPVTLEALAPIADDHPNTLADAGTAPIDAGSVTCAPGECACTRDNDCPAELVCDHAAGVCVAPPVRCVDLTTEAACVAASTMCTPVYAGQNCRDATGGECTAGDVNCTCATFSFAACVDR